MERCRLELVGITYNQIESGVYAVILREVDGDRRIPIIIGYPEAQAIECKLQEVVTPRPLTHDMMINTLSAFNITLLEVNIRKMPNGIFAADLLFSDGVNTRVIDSRSSDAIALAIRVGAPIYTSEEVLRVAGFRPEDIKRQLQQSKGANRPASTLASKPTRDTFANNIGKLEEEMRLAAENEDYELAARLRNKIEKLKAEKEDQQLNDSETNLPNADVSDSSEPNE